MNWEKTNDKKYKEYRAKYEKTDNYKMMIKKRQAKFLAEHPIQANAIRRFNTALKRGKFQRELCKFCNAKAEAHHYNGYDEDNWKKVIWLCRLHHRGVHRDIFSITPFLKEKEK